jgi:hypothetical protein
MNSSLFRQISPLRMELVKQSFDYHNNDEIEAPLFREVEMRI